MDTQQKNKIIEKFKNAIQKIGNLMQNIVFYGEDGQIVKNIQNNLNQKERYFNQIEFRRREVNNSLPEEVRDEVSSRVRTAVISGYSELNIFLSNEQQTSKGFEQVNQSLKETARTLQEIPDEVDGMFKDKKLNFKNLRTYVGFETVECNEQNANASIELLNNLKTNNPQIQPKQKAKSM